MRDKRFISEHRGGPLKKEQYIQLIQWACNCAENVLSLFGEKTTSRSGPPASDPEHFGREYSGLNKKS